MVHGHHIVFDKATITATEHIDGIEVGVRVVVVVNRVSAEGHMVGEGGIDGLAALVGERAALHQESVVELGHVGALVIETYKAIDKLTAYKSIIGIHPAAGNPINQVLVVVGIGGFRIATHKAHLLKTVV